MLSADIVLVELHDPTGGRVLVNEHEISSLRLPTGPTPPGAKCALYMSSGNVLIVREDCDAVRDAIRLAR